MQCGGTTHVLRLGWSPDGNYVVSSHAMNNSGPVAQIIDRDGWQTNLDFVGHRKAITVVVRKYFIRNGAFKTKRDFWGFFCGNGVNHSTVVVLWTSGQ